MATPVIGQSLHGENNWNCNETFYFLSLVAPNKIKSSCATKSTFIEYPPHLDSWFLTKSAGFSCFWSHDISLKSAHPPADSESSTKTLIDWCVTAIVDRDGPSLCTRVLQSHSEVTKCRGFMYSTSDRGDAQLTHCGDSGSWSGVLVGFGRTDDWLPGVQCWRENENPLYVALAKAFVLRSTSSRRLAAEASSGVKHPQMWNHVDWAKRFDFQVEAGFVQSGPIHSEATSITQISER